MGNRFDSGWELVVQDTCPESLLNALSEQEVRFCAPQMIDRVTICLRVPYGEIRQVRAIAEKRGSELRLCRPFGVRPLLLRLRTRTALLVSLMFCGVLLAASNLFVWRVDVVGNESIPTGRILRAVSRAGGAIGSFWPVFDSEQMRTELLLQLEDIQWVGINYRSGVVEVVVRERRQVPEVVDNDAPVHIAAEKAGVITSITAKQGQTAAAAGDTVEQGQVLISGAAVSSIGTTRPVHALGTVQARTWYAFSARLPDYELRKVYSGRKNRKISLILGTNRVNFYSNSSIFEDSCDTIIMDYHLCVDGVFALPVRIIVQECLYRSAAEYEQESQIQQDAAQRALMAVLRQKIGEEGSVTAADFAAVKRDRGMTVTLMAECVEEIGAEMPLSQEELQRIQQENTLREEATND